VQVSGPLALVAYVARRDIETTPLAVGKSARLSFPPEAVYVMGGESRTGEDANC
jgi:hypothetical protein